MPGLVVRFVPVLALALGGACEDPRPCPAQVGWICAVAGTGELGFNQDGLAARETDLFLVSAARRGPDGRVTMMDFNNQRLRVIDDEGLVRTLAGNGLHAFASTGIPAVESPLENPVDFRFLSGGRPVFVSYHDPRVLVLDHDGTLRALAGDGEIGLDGDEGDGGPALEARFMQLDGIAVGPDDTLWVSDSIANRVRRIRDGVITTVAGDGAPAYRGDGGPGTQAALHWPTALELDRDGDLLIADTYNHVVRELSMDGTITTRAGTGESGVHGDDGPAVEAQLAFPMGLAVDTDGTLYIADRDNFRVRAVDPDGIIRTVAGTGAEGHRGDGGPAVDARLGNVARIALDEDGLLIADQTNSVVRRMNL